MSLLPLRSRQRLTILATALLTARAAGAQGPLAPITTTPISDVSADWMNEGAVSPNGRFYLLTSFAGGAVTSYDARNRRWTPVADVQLGQQIAWSPDGRFVASVRVPEGGEGTHLWLTPMDSARGIPSGTPRRISTRIARAPAWSPDGRRIVFSSADSGTFSVVMIPFNGGNEEFLFRGKGRGGATAWSPDGRTVFAGYRPEAETDQWIRIDVATKRVTTFPAGPALRVIGFSKDGRRIVHHDQLTSRLTISSVDDGRLLQSLQLPGRLVPALAGQAGRDTIIALEHIVPSQILQAKLPEGTLTPLVPLDSVTINSPAYSPDGRQMAFIRTVGNSSRVFVMSQSGEGLRTIGDAGTPRLIDWSPDGRSIAACSAESVHVIDVATGRDRVLAQHMAPESVVGVRCSWSRGGAAIRYVKTPRGQGMKDHELREVTLTGADRLVARIAAVTPPQPLGDSLAAAARPEGLVLHDLTTGRERTVFKGRVFTWDVARSNDGRQIAFGVQEGEQVAAQIVDVATGESRRLAFTHGGEIATMRFHPDGRHVVASVCMTCVSPQWREKWDVVLVPLNGDPLRVLTASRPTYKDFGTPTISPDGRTIAFEAEASYHTRIVTLTLPPSR